MGGENFRSARFQLGREGSSPRGRGKRHPVRHRRARKRLIPAWAGKTHLRYSLRTGYRAHPRVGGENWPTRGAGSSACGSSPRGRGKREEAHLTHGRVRLIPAWAGKTESRARWARLTAAHPRVGGENYISLRLNGHRGWLIPAWAGKTRILHDRSHRRGAHPRVGGENVSMAPLGSQGWGSSPRGRGKQRHTTKTLTFVRLIPAWAGKTGVYLVTTVYWLAHPRVGGENAQWKSRASRNCGSSPRGRGKPDSAKRERYVPGLIPAWAGKTPLKNQHTKHF